MNHRIHPRGRRFYFGAAALAALLVLAAISIVLALATGSPGAVVTTTGHLLHLI
jgi:hypothetical protein